MKEKDLTSVYCLYVIICILYLLYSETISLSFSSIIYNNYNNYNHNYNVITSKYLSTIKTSRTLSSISSHRQLISKRDTCTSKECTNLYFLSGIYDIMNLDVRFTSPYEQRKAKTLFEEAKFSQYAYSNVKEFSSFEFFLSSAGDKETASTISGSYVLDNLVNGSSIIVASEIPGREILFYDDTLSAPTCLNQSTSMIIFVNTLNNKLDLYTKTPEGVCEKIEMDNQLSSPLTYCQAIGGYVWEIFTDWKCSTQMIASDYIDGGLGTVFCVVVGDNVSTAEVVSVSSSSSFKDVNIIKEDVKIYPSFFQRKNGIITICMISVAIGIIIIFIIAIKSRKPVVIGFKEGDIVIYNLTLYQLNMLQQKETIKGKNTNHIKTKGFALIVKGAPTIGIFARYLSSMIQQLEDSFNFRRNSKTNQISKSVLRLQPLKSIIRKNDDNNSDNSNNNNNNNNNNVSDEENIIKIENNNNNNNNITTTITLELIIDENEAPISVNYWGFRGGRVLTTISPENIQRRTIYVGDIQFKQKNSVRFSDPKVIQDEKDDITEKIWLDSLETDNLIDSTTKENSMKSPLRNRKNQILDVGIVPENKLDNNNNNNNQNNNNNNNIEEKNIKDENNNSKSYFINLWKKLYGSKFIKSLDFKVFGLGWISGNGDDGAFLLDQSNPINDDSLQPFLQKRSTRYETTIKINNNENDNNNENNSNESKDEILPPHLEYSYLIKNLSIEDNKDIYTRDWIYPFNNNGEVIKIKEKSNRKISKDDSIKNSNTNTNTKTTSILSKQNQLLQNNQQLSSLSPIKESPQINKKKDSSNNSNNKISTETDDLLNVLIKEQQEITPQKKPFNSVVSQFTSSTSPQPVGVRIALRREQSRKNRTSLLQSSIVSNNLEVPIFTTPRVISPFSPSPFESNSSKMDEISTPSSPQPYFVTPPRSTSLKDRKSIKHLNLDLYSQTEKKEKRSGNLLSPNSSPQLNASINSITSSEISIPPNIIQQKPVNADREVNIGSGKVDKVVAGSKLEIDEDEDDIDNEGKEILKPLTQYKIKKLERETSLKRTSQSHNNNNNNTNNNNTSSGTNLPPVVSPRLSTMNQNNFDVTKPISTFTASPKKFTIKNSPRKTLSARKFGESEKIIHNIELEVDEMNEEAKPQRKLDLRNIKRASTKFDMDLSFINDVKDD